MIRNYSLVLYCFIKKKIENKIKYLMITKNNSLCFPVTKFRDGEDIYNALMRSLHEDVGLPEGTFYPEEELPMIENSKDSVEYENLSKQWYLYPVEISVSKDGWDYLTNNKFTWLSPNEIKNQIREPNVLKIVSKLSDENSETPAEESNNPSMEALASYWAFKNNSGARILRKEDIFSILNAGNRAFNLRVADPYLPYQKQGFGFTWSFFTPKDKQDVHVHGLPAVEIYGIFEGELLFWHKPINLRGARVWKCEHLKSGDWIEVEPLSCHFTCWLTKDGMGTVIKAAGGGGNLAGVGKIGIAGKTVCKECNVNKQCIMHPLMKKLVDEYQKDFTERDYLEINNIFKELKST